MGMFPNNVTGSSSESNTTITFVDTDARAGVSAIGARSDRAGVSAIGARSLAGDWRSDILFLSERLSETLFIGQPLQRLSSAASERPQKNRRTFCDDNFHSCLRPGPGQRPKL